MLPALLLLAASPSLAVTAPRTDAVHHLPLTRGAPHRSAGGGADLARLVAAADALRYKYNIKSRVGLGTRASEAAVNIISEAKDTTYLASISVGTPAQTLNVVLDTGSSDLWFTMSTCTKCPPSVPKLDLSKSSTLNTSSQAVQLPYGSGNAAGSLLQDVVTLGPYTVSNQTFTGVTNLTSGLIGGASGILGLGFSTIAVSGAPTLWERLVSAGELSAPEMGFYLTRYVADETRPAEHGGTFTLGGTNSSLFKGDVHFTPLPAGFKPSFWLQTVSGLMLNGAVVDIGQAADNLAAVDTGTTLLGGPSAAVRAFWAQVSGAQAQAQSQGFWAFPCSTAVNASLAFGGTAWPISPADMSLGEIAPGLCLGTLFELTQGTQTNPSSLNWIIGDTFLKNVYTVLRAGDAPAVGFAELAVGSSGSPTTWNDSSSTTPSALPSGAPGLPTGSAPTSGGSSSGARAQNARGAAGGALLGALALALVLQ